MPDIRSILKQKFTEEYEKLNAEQRKAVDTIDGPVMVIAGPGTGKTQILAARIGKILLETDTSPENILCLTYTDAGSIAMRKRLQQFIGADAYKVNIHTFHAFCNEVIQENLHLFEKTSLDAISELENIQLFKQLIDAFPKNHLLKRYRGDVYYEINNLKNLFSSMKREGWKTDFFHQKIDEYINSLQSRVEYIAKRATKDFKKGDIRIDKIAEETEKMEKLRCAVSEFEKYQGMMRTMNRYDFDDMILWVIKMFEEQPQIRAAYQERYQYLLVDEYQDTSGTQNSLISLLTSFWDNPNVFVVGDDDQSIYRFQGASMENMLDFANAYTKDLVKIVLTNNYRSTQPILDIAHTVISRNMERLVNQIEGLSKDLVSCRLSIKDLKDPPILREYNTTKDEMADITNRVAELLEQGVLPGNIGVIYKENKYGAELAKYFHLKNIPFYSKRNIDILHHPFSKKLIQILRFLNAEHDIPYGGDEMLFEILHFDFFSIQPLQVAKLTVEVNSKKYNEQSSLRRLLSEKANEPAKDLFDTGIDSHLKHTSEILEQLIGDVSNCTLQQLFENIIRTAGVLSYIMKSDEKIGLMQVLTALFDFIKEETARNPQLDLKGLVDIIDLMQKEGIPLPMVQVAGSEKGVNLLTAHGAKGLEFEYVFFAGVNASFWEKKRKPGGGYKYPDTLFQSQSGASEIEELRRLFYVALTRAERQLAISYAKFKNDGKEIEPSMFIAEITDMNPLAVEKILLSSEQQMEYELLQFTVKVPEIEKAEEDFITGLLDKFVMNVTALNNYLRCPLEFYYKTLIRIPSGKSEATEFGSAIHFALERLFRKMSDGAGMQQDIENQFPPVTEVIENFNWYMNRHRENFTREAFARRMEYGHEVLENYYNKYVNSWNRIVSVERNISGVVVNGVPLKGKLDKLEFNGKEVNVVDYKTGDIDKSLTKLHGPNEKDPNGGDYWRQAVFYKMLVDGYEQKDWKVVSTEFDFIEPDKKKQYRKAIIYITEPDMETVKQQLTETWNKIQAREFYTGCGKEDCHWCNFVRDNNIAVALHELEEESTE